MVLGCFAVRSILASRITRLFDCGVPKGRRSEGESYLRHLGDTTECLAVLSYLSPLAPCLKDPIVCAEYVG